MKQLVHRKAKRVRNTDPVRIKMHVTKGDTVQVISGDDKGREGKVLRVFTKTGRVLVEGVNIVKRHRRARTAEEQSGIVEMPAPVAASNVMLLDPKTGAPTRVRAQIDVDATEQKQGRRKERISVKSGDAIPRAR